MIPSLQQVVDCLAPAFTQPSFATCGQLLLAWALCLGKHTLMRVGHSADPTEPPDLSRRHGLDTYYNFFERSAWAPAVLAQRVGLLILTSLRFTGLVVLLVDDTLTHKTGKSVWGLGWFRDAVASTRKRVATASGHNWVVLAIAFCDPLTKMPVLALPLLARLHRPGKGQPSCPQLAREMLIEVLGWFGGRRFTLVGDGAYASSLASSKAPGRSSIIVTSWAVFLYKGGGRRCGRGRRGPRGGGSAGAGEHALQVEPAAPQHQPARRAVALPALVPAQPPQGQEERAHAQRPPLPVPPAAQHLHVPLVQHLRRRQLAQPLVPAEVAQAEQLHRHHAQQGDHRPQPLHLGELRVFYIATCLLRLVELLDDPTTTIPVHFLPCLLHRLHRQVGQQEPLHRLGPLGGPHLPDPDGPQPLRLLAVRPPVVLRGQDLHRRPGDGHRGLPRRPLLALGQLDHPPRLLGQAAQVAVQLDRRPLPAVAHPAVAVVLRAEYELALQQVLMVDELQGVAAAVGDVYLQRPPGRAAQAQPAPAAPCRLGQVIDGPQPQQALAAVAVAALGGRLILGDARADVQDLADQAHDRAALGQDSQAVEALVALAEAVADLAEVWVHRGEAGVVQLAAVVQEQHDALLLLDQAEGALNVRRQDGLVGDGGGFHEVVTPAQHVGALALVRQGAGGVTEEAIGQVHQAAGAAGIAEVGFAEVLLPEAQRQDIRAAHGTLSLGEPAQSLSSSLYKQSHRSGQT